MKHPSRHEIAKVIAGTAGPKENAETLAHLIVCPTCPAEAERLLKLPSSSSVSHLLRECLNFSQEGVVAMLLADVQWAEIRGLSAKAQKERIATTSVCKTAVFARRLLDELSDSDGWDHSERLAALVATCINAMDQTEYSPSTKSDFRAEVMIELANSRRRAAEWKRADEALQRAEEFLTQGTGSMLLRARYLAIYGSLEADRRKLENALQAFEKSRAIYEELGQVDRVARTSLQIADTLSETDPTGVLTLLDEVDRLLTPCDPLMVNARLLRVECLIAKGDPGEAALRLMHCERPRRGRMLIRYRFIGARLLHALGHRNEAERLFHEVVTDDLEGELFKDALLDLLYLLKLHILEGELSKAIAVCQRALGEAVLAEFAHEQLRSVWQEIASAIEARALSPEALSTLKLYMCLHWKHPSSSPPSVKSHRR